MTSISHMDVKFLWGNSNYDYVCSESLGNSGGILCIWEASIFKKINTTVSDNFIAIYGTWLPTNSKILFIAIYAPQQTSCKRKLWDYISNIVGRWNGESIIMGDFNEVRSSEERRGSCFNPYSARYFDRFISNAGLVDVTLEGYAFTWAHPSASKMSKLDRFLVSDGIFSLFPSITAICLDRHLSDHRPILLREVKLDFGPTPFRFYHSWFDYVGFDDMIKLSWHSFSHSDTSGMIRFKKKLQDLKKIIRSWIKAKKLEISGSKNEMISELGAIDKDMDRGVFDDDTVFRRFELKHKLLNVSEMESKDNFQKSKVKWAVEGDENSKFFHGIINKRRAQLAIRGIFVDGFWETEPGMIKDAFFNHFASRFKEPANHRFKLNFEFNKKLHQNQMEDLERSVSRDEIRRAVWSCGDNKSPGPDGFTFEFFKKYWDCIGSDFCEAVEYFFVNSSFSKGCNSSFVALIPKVMDAKFVNDFRPISLIGSVYKVVTKVLANRLAPVIADLISDTQSAFVAGRQILDGPFILDEILHWCKRKNKKAMFFKVDFAKAYDSVRWDYLLEVLEAFGFGRTWCNWIRGTLTSAKASILINGSPSKEYSCHRGLKQGDPLAPYLFILIMESLHLSFNRVVDEGLFKGIQLPGSLSLSHLFYADDAMFIGEWSNENLSGIINILKSFFLASGLQINILKSQLLGVCVPHQVVEQAASLIGLRQQQRKGNESQHAYFATWRDKEWMMIELDRYSNHKEDVVFEFLLESFSSYHCGDGAIYVEGIEFRAIEKVKLEDIGNLEEVPQVLKSYFSVDQLPAKFKDIFKKYTKYEDLFWFGNVNGKKILMLSAKATIPKYSDAKLYSSRRLINCSSQFAVAVAVRRQPSALRPFCQTNHHRTPIHIMYIIAMSESKDRGWMYKRRNSEGHLCSYYQSKVSEFLNFAFSIKKVVEVRTLGSKVVFRIKCPCSMSKIKVFKERHEVEYDLWSNGFVRGYTTWYAHGEIKSKPKEIGQCSKSMEVDDVGGCTTQDFGYVRS
ncbi:RNA-directed DNA polymerase, eukaryota [Tanacetum coccineum]